MGGRIKEEEDFQKYLEECEKQKECDRKEMEIKQLHLNEAGLKNDEIDTKRRKKLRDRLVKCNNKQKVAPLLAKKMTKEEAQKVIPTLDLGDDMEEFKEGEVTKYKVIKKSDTTELNHDWRVIWKDGDFTRIKYENPTFKLESFEKPTKNEPCYNNDIIRKKLKMAYDDPKYKGKILIWNHERGQAGHKGGVDVYNGNEGSVFSSVESNTEKFRMEWDDSKDLPYYVYKIYSKSTPTYVPPPKEQLGSLIKPINIDKIEESSPAGLKSEFGGKRKTRKQKKKTKKAGKKTTQKKRKQRKQKRGTRSKK